MGFVDKIKNLFTEEVEVEETPIQKEVMQVEIPAPTSRSERNGNIANDITENDTLKKDEKLRTPVFFDDKDFVNLEQAKLEKKELPKKETYQGLKKEEKKKFKPSPIISPVYGVLEKNYHKEDIKEHRRGVPVSSGPLTVDDVRKKAFGTLEDDLETTMFNNSILFREEPEVEELEFTEEKAEPKDEFDEFNLLDHEIIVEEKDVEEKEPTTREERNKTIDVLSGLEMDTTEEELFDAVEEVRPIDADLTPSTDNLVAEEIEQVEKPETPDLKESELFDLIDSMYEKKEDEK